MKTHRVWVEIVILGSSVACALALLIATLGTVAGAANGAGEPRQATSATTAEQTYQGMVTCSRCGAKHSAALGKTAADCVRVCVSGGAKFSLVDGEQTYFLDGDNSLLKGLAGRRTRVVGTISGKTIKVSSIATT
jgi:hypothetical protein